jgi:hypothetical protein
MYPERVAVWCALSSVGIFSAVFIDGTVTSDVYLSLLTDEFVLFLVIYGISMNSAQFQQDGAKPHIRNAVLRVLHKFFKERARLNRYPTLFE